MYRKVTAIVLGSILLAAPVIADEASDKAFKNAVSMAKARQGYMQLQNQQMAAMADASVGKAEITADVIVSAQNLVNLTLMMSGIFGEGSGLDVVDFSRAMPELWTNASERDALINRLNGQAMRLAATAVEGDPTAFQSAFKQLKGTCNKCHETFRAKTAPRDL